MQVTIPPLGESITQATLLAWHKPDGQPVALDEPVCELETDKANVDIPANAAGILHHLKQPGDVVKVGEAIARIDEVPAGATPAAVTAPAAPAIAPLPPAPSSTPPEDLRPSVRRLVEEHRLDPRAVPPTGPGGRLTKEDVATHLAHPPQPPQRETPPPPPPSLPKPAPAAAALPFDSAGLARVPMTKLRKRIAERLVQAQHTAAILTTFNEIDLTEVIGLRNKYKERFQEIHGVGLGFMSFFARAVAIALQEMPTVNAFIEGEEIVYHNFVNLGLAVSTDRGLAVPILHNVQEMSFAKIEGEIKRVSAAVREGKLGIEELSGGTFTITNGGVFGSLLSTPILTPPQSAILGMHAIQKRPVVIDDKIEIRSMMYVALSYDHRLVDGREAITFLVRIKQLLEDPARMVLGI